MRLIVTDIDGTLIDHDGQLPLANSQALANAHERGVRVAIATVRKRDATEAITQLLNMPCILICQGGAAMYDETGATLQTIPIAFEIAQSIAEICDQEGLPLLTTVEETNYFGPHTPKPRFMVRPGHDVVRNSDALSTAPTRLIVYGDHAVNRIMTTFANAPLQMVRHYDRDGQIQDMAITNRDATKERAFSLLCNRLGIDPAEAIALGDSESDIGMIRRAGIGIAMGDAHLNVRAAADWVAPRAADAGLAAAINRFVLS